jgi:hypothetical protein
MSLLNSLYQAPSPEQEKLAVWAKGKVIPNFDPSVWRSDRYGNVIRYQDYGDRQSKYGWEIDHYPTAAALGGSDDISNLQPLHCKANASRGGALGGLLSR